MIHSLHPEFISAGQGNLLAQVGGFTFSIEASQVDIGYFLVLAEENDDNQPIEIFIEMELSDSAITLVGFASQERRELYRGLKNVAGIGTKSALSILDCGEVIDVLRAVSGKDVQFLRGISGVGEKRVGYIFKELEKRYRKALPKKVPVPVSEWVEAREALNLSGLNFAQSENFIIEVVDSLDEEEAKKIDAEALYLKAIKFHPEITSS